MDYAKKMETAVKDLCRNCTQDPNSGCDKQKCLVAFALDCLQSYNAGNGPRIEDGLNKLPLQDYKVYEQEDAARIIAIACKWCHNCSEDHSENCVVSLCRRAMEFGITGDEITFKGSSFVYLKELETINAGFSAQVYEQFKQLS